MIQIPADARLSFPKPGDSASKRESTDRQTTLFVGFAVFDIEAAALARGKNERAEKVDARVELALGGGAPNMALAYFLASGRRPALAAITGADPLGEAIEGMLRQQFPAVHRVATAKQTRLSVITPAGDGSTSSLTVRPPIDDAATLDRLLPLLSARARIVVASLTAEHGSFLRPLKQRLAQLGNRNLCMLLTRSQCEDRLATLSLCRGCQLVAMNARELEILTGIPGDVAAGVQWLQQRGVRGVFVTDGCRGITVSLNKRRCHVPAFRIGDSGGTTIRCGDIALGTFLCGLDSGRSIEQSLRLAAAAAAMKIAGAARRPGWNCLENFAAAAPTYPTTRIAADGELPGTSTPASTPASTPVVKLL